MAEIWPQLHQQKWGSLIHTLRRHSVHRREWDRLNLEESVEEYKKFLALKVLFNDVNAEILSPSNLIDQIWHIDILDTRTYAQRFRDINSEFIHHSPITKEECLDFCAKQSCRYKRTYKGLFRHFGEPNPIYWPLPASSTRFYPPTNRKEEDTFQIFYKAQKTHCLDVHPKDSLGYVFQNIVEAFNTGILKYHPNYLETDDISIIYAGKRLLASADIIVEDINITQDSTLHVVRRLRGC